jgi:translation initiation factor IF-2
LAKELGVGTKELIDRLAAMKITVKSASSSVEEDVAEKLRKEIKPAGKEDAERKAAPSKEKGAKAAPPAAKSAPPPKAKTPPAPKKKIAHQEPPPAQAVADKAAPPPTAEKIMVQLPATVRKLAEVLHVKSEDLIRTLMNFGVMATINQNLDAETVEIIAHEHGREVELIVEPAAAGPVEEEKDLAPRAPVVTFMGHIDHGKTSLLDAIRETKVVAKEAGGITQHIGAYEVKVGKGSITFLDTPGHETFTSMRARGANVTDVAVLVVAADDGVMPQTREAIDHARAAKVPIVVAVNKIDKPGVSPDKVRKQLMELDLSPEEYGGQTICCDVSAVTRQGIDHLLEMILLQAEMMELKASPTTRARAVIIEAQMDKERGAVATALVKKGTIRLGDPIVCGTCSGKVKALFDYRGERVREGGPATPLEVLGLDGVPQPGEELVVVDNEREAKRTAAARRMERGAPGAVEAAKMTLEELYSKIAAGKAKELDLVLKGDVQGSVEALRDALKTMGNENVSVNIIRCAVGDINENDVMLASASNAVIIGFHARIDLSAKELSRKESVEIKLYDVIYEVIEDVRKALEGLLEPAIKETILGRAEVKQVFRAAKGEPVAGSIVIEGKVVENAQARLIRGDKIIQEGSIVSIRRFKDPVKEVKAGTECGIRLANLADHQEGDIIEVFKMEKVPQRL